MYLPVYSVQCTQMPDGKSAVLHWNRDEIAWKGEKKIKGIMEKRVDFEPGQRKSPQRIVYKAIFRKYKYHFAW